MPDIRHTIIAKSDQWNADDLLGQKPMDLRILGVEVRDSGEQMVSVYFAGRPNDRPWKPCKTMLRLLSAAWGPESEDWHDRWCRVYRDDAVTFGKDAVGGIRVSHVSHIADASMRIAVNSTRGRKKMIEVGRLEAVDLVMADLGMSAEQVNAWLASKDKPPIQKLAPHERDMLAGALPKNIEAIKGVGSE